MRGDLRPEICRIKRMNSASKCLIQHFEALIVILLRIFLQKVVEIITTICYNSDEEGR